MQAGEAGRRGETVRSDCWVRVETKSSGGVQVQLRSKVAAYYGGAIEAQVRDQVRAAELRHAAVEVEDGGALPFVLAARTAAALHRAGAASLQALLPPPAEARPAQERNRLRRSRLYLPGNEPKFMVNAGLHGADAVILDLEDSVHPDEKDAARFLVAYALATLDFGESERTVRINAGASGREDLEAVLAQRPDAILLPKAESADAVTALAEVLDARYGAPTSGPWIVPIVESALGVERAFEIASAHARVAALAVGLEDYTADLGVARTPEGREVFYARTRLVNAARAAGIQPLDSVYSDVADPEGLERYARDAKALGFEGMGCLHPRQIGVIHRAFAPEEDEIRRALAVVEAFERAQAEGRAVVSLGSKMVDPPVVERARGLVERARKLGLIEDTEARGKRG